MNFQSSRVWAAIAAVNGALAVGIGAYGYHKLSDDAALREVFATAVQYHMFHTLALFAVAWLAANRTDRAAYWAVRAGWSFLGGIGLFSGSLYGYCLLNSDSIGAAGPIGGMLFISGWVMLAWSAMKKPDAADDGGSGDA